MQEYKNASELKKHGAVQNVRKSLRIISQSADDVVRRLDKQGQPIACKGKGCSSCCYIVTIISLPEMMNIAGHYPQIVHDVAEKAEEQAALLRQPGMDTRSWAKLRRPCVFLDEENGTCRVYDSRPMACRVHMAFSDPQYCHADYVEQYTPVYLDFTVHKQAYVESTVEYLADVGGLRWAPIPALIKPILELLRTGTYVSTRNEDLTDSKYWYQYDDATVPIVKKIPPGVDIAGIERAMAALNQTRD